MTIRSVRWPFLLALAALLGAAAWFAQSGMEALLDRPAPIQVVIFRPFLELGAWIAAALALVLALVFWTRKLRADADQREAGEGREAVWARRARVTGVVFLCLPAASLLLASPHVLGRLSAPWVFLFADARIWMLLAGCAVAVPGVESLARVVRAPSNSSSSLIARIPPGALLAVLLAGVALAALPGSRFNAVVTGDEPKYLRFAENWYRGQGLNIEHFPDIRDLPPDFRPDVVANVRHVIEAVRIIAHDAAKDIAGQTGAVEPQDDRQPSGSNWFLKKPGGGVYQVHNPGFPVLLFPGYFIDRYLLNTTSEFHPQFPTYLYATRTILLACYVLWGVALFRFLRERTGDSAIPWVVALVTMASLPATAFSYQYYPEAAAGLLVTVSATYALRESITSRAAFLLGCVAGYLPWLHFRFGPVTFLLAIFFAVRQRRARPRVIWFCAGAALPLIAMVAYTYYLAGSIFPWTLYALMPDNPGFDPVRALREVPQLWLDRTWGIVPLAPIYLLALPGLVPGWRRSRADTGFVILACFGLALLAASHGITGGYTTPGRLIAAVVPLLGLPLAAALARYRHSRWFLSVFVVLALLSVRNGLLYDRFFVRSNTAFTVPNLAAWSTTLLFPDMQSHASGTTAVILLWMLVAALLLLMPLLRERSKRATPPAPVPYATAALGTLLAIAVLGSMIGGWTGVAFSPGLVTDRRVSAARLLKAHLVDSTRVIWSPQLGVIDAQALFPLPSESTLIFTPARLGASAGRDVNVKVEAPGIAWGTAVVDYGDGTPAERLPFVGAERIHHTYARVGEYDIVVHLLPPRRTVAGTAPTPMIDGSVKVTVNQP